MNKSIPNQWTHKIDNSSAQNRNVWQVGSYELKGITFVGVFNHLLVDDTHTTGLEEGGGMESESADKLMIEAAQSLISKDYFIYAHVLLQRQVEVDDLVLIAPTDNNGLLTVKVGKRHELLHTYFLRLGSNPDDEPDVLYMATKEIDSQFESLAHKDFLKKMGRKSISTLGDADLLQWNDLLDLFPEILYAVDGHIYFVTKQRTKEDLFKKIQKVADTYHLTMATDHILY